MTDFFIFIGIYIIITINIISLNFEKLSRVESIGLDFIIWYSVLHTGSLWFWTTKHFVRPSNSGRREEDKGRGAGVDNSHEGVTRHELVQAGKLS